MYSAGELTARARKDERIKLVIKILHFLGLILRKRCENDTEQYGWKNNYCPFEFVVSKRLILKKKNNSLIIPKD